jgi:hypothetical protein
MIFLMQILNNFGNFIKFYKFVVLTYNFLLFLCVCFLSLIVSILILFIRYV